MKRIVKNKNSEILKLNLSYSKDSKKNKKIREILEKEQDRYCAYTETKIDATFSVDIEHFNPKLKYTDKDSYKNWFAVSHKWNNKKGIKWDNFQPTLHPTAKDLEQRLIYDEDTASYICKIEDIEANNLMKLIDLNNSELVESRENYINLLKILYKEAKEVSFFDWITKPKKEKEELTKYRRAIETVFDISL